MPEQTIAEQPRERAGRGQTDERRRAEVQLGRATQQLVVYVGIDGQRMHAHAR
jgi:hypothetical protein